MSQQAIGHRGHHGFTVSPRLLDLAEILGRWGPLPGNQLKRVLAALLPALAVGKSAARLLRRELERLKKVGFLGLRHHMDGEAVYWLKPEGEEYLLGLGRLSESRGDVANRYFGQPLHSALTKHAALTLLLARHDGSLVPKIESFTWDERINWPVALPHDPGRGRELEPDAVTCVRVGGERPLRMWIVEADTGQEHLRGRWAEKIDKYAAWWQAVKVDRFRLPRDVVKDQVRVLVVTPGVRRCQNLAAVTADLCQDRGPAFLFTTASEWMPESLWKPVWLPAGYGERPSAGATKRKSLLEVTPWPSGRAV